MQDDSGQIVARFWVSTGRLMARVVDTVPQELMFLHLHFHFAISLFIRRTRIINMHAGGLRREMHASIRTPRHGWHTLGILLFSLNSADTA